MGEVRPVQADTGQWPRLSPTSTGLYGKCPRCGLGHIFKGFLKIREQCEVCDLNFDFADPADGPAVFVQLFASVPGVIFLLLLEVVFGAPNWVLLVVGLPVVVITTVLPLRPIKGWLIAAQYTYNAQQAGTQNQWDQLNAGDPENDSEQSNL